MRRRCSAVYVCAVGADRDTLAATAAPTPFHFSIGRSAQHLKTGSSGFRSLGVAFASLIIVVVCAIHCCWLAVAFSAAIG
jgi:hypothetical protein